MFSYSAVVDLSHRLGPDLPVWPGDPAIEYQPVASIDREGYFLQACRFGEHSGTHIGTSAHFYADGIIVDRLPPELLVRPIVTIDATDAAARDCDYRLPADALLRWEQEHGRIPAGVVVLLRTGWSRHIGDRERYFGYTEGNDTMHFPGFHIQAARFLAEEREVIGLGTDTAGIDAGIDSEFPVNAYWLRGNRFHLENLTNLDRLPPTGALLFIGALGMAGGSGSPARLLALLPGSGTP